MVACAKAYYEGKELRLDTRTRIVGDGTSRMDIGSLVAAFRRMDFRNKGKGKGTGKGKGKGNFGKGEGKGKGNFGKGKGKGNTDYGKGKGKLR